MSTTHTERKVIFLLQQGWVAEDVTGHGQIVPTAEAGQVVLDWIEYRGSDINLRHEATGMTVDQFAAAIQAI